jgi:hypothetical protein
VSGADPWGYDPTATLYTIAQIADIGDQLLGGYKRKPLTRRQRLVRHLRAYITHLGLALLNRCDREGDDL